jgi:nitrite reductase/ring-hydroxylating ferredoxin subunit
MPSAGPGTSVIIVKDRQEVVRAFYNMCRHRGNKLVWNDYPGEEVSGTCRQFTCKYHAWRYSLEGDLTFVQQEGEFFDLDKANYGLVSVRCEVWEGFIFINFDNDAIPLTEYLGDFAKGLEGYPFHEMTEHYSYRSEINANWKLFIDAHGVDEFCEVYFDDVVVPADRMLGQPGDGWRLAMDLIQRNIIARRLLDLGKEWWWTPSRPMTCPCWPTRCVRR